MTDPALMRSFLEGGAILVTNGRKYRLESRHEVTPPPTAEKVDQRARRLHDAFPDASDEIESIRQEVVAAL